MTQVQRKDDQGAAVHVAAFGKHPGWDDHIEEIGLDTDWLVNAKRVLYTDCIGGCVDSGEWEKLDEDKRLPFGHNFLWRTPEAVIVGRMWNSRDGKGRTKYPMIVCAAVHGAGAEWTVSQVLPRLAAIEAKCSGTSSAEMVRLALGELRTELEAAAANRGQTTMMQSSGGLLSRLLASPPLSGENRTGLQRVLYEMGRELQEFRSTGTTSIKPRAYVPACQHIRVPRGLPAPGEGARAWLAVMDQEITHAAPLLVLEPNGQRFLDIIVGEPKPKVFQCARTGEQALALTSDVPYSMDAADIATAESKINAWSQGRASTGGELVAPPEPSVAKSHLKLVLLGAAGILLVIVVIALMKVTRKSPAAAAAASVPGATESEPPRRTTRGAAPAPQPSNDPADPRTGWKLDAELASARASLDAADRELAYEHAPALKAHREALDDVAERAAIVRGTQWRDASREVIAHDVAEIDGALAASVTAISEAHKGITSRVRAGLEQRAATPPVRAPAFAAAWAAGLKKIDDSAGWAASRAKADALESALKQADAAIATVGEPAVPAGWTDADGALKRAADARRERAVREAVDAAAAGDSAGVARAADGLRQWSQQAGALLTAVNDLGHAADTGEAASIAQAENAVKTSPLAAELGPLAAPALARAQAAASVGTQSQPAVLESMVREAGQDSAGAKAPLAVAAWTRLAALHWPQSPADLQSATALCTGELKNALDRIPDAARREELSARAATATAAMWSNYAASASDEAGVAAAAAAQRTMGIDDKARQSLPARARYNLARQELSQGAPGRGGSASIRAFIGTVDKLGPEVASRPEVSGLVAALRPLADPMSDVDLAKLGPGSAGWKAMPAAADGSLTYSWDHAGQTHTLTFKPVPVAGAPAFVSTCEVSAGLFIDAVTAAHKWDDVKAELQRYPVGGEDPRKGPRVWEWTGSADTPMAIAKPGKGDLSKGWLRVRPQMAGKESYAEGAKVDPPSRAHPMQYVSPRAAVLMARTAGCRIPTTSEWQAASSANTAQAHNLRDLSWHQHFVRTEQLKTFLPDFPSAGIFWPRETQKKIEADKDGAAAVESDDGTIWFMPVAAGNGFQHLVGNVAEFVWDDAPSLEGLEATGAKVKAVLGKGEKLHVIGGSALSSKDVSNTEPQPVSFALAGGGYSDVGFRLAFSAPPGSGGEGFAANLSAALAASRYLPPGSK